MPITEFLELLRIEPSAAMAWSKMLNLLREQEPSGLWDALPSVDINEDCRWIKAWAAESLSGLDQAGGVYLGLDTLNMESGRGTNVEIGWLLPFDTSRSDADWIYDGLEYGKPTLISGLHRLHAVYSEPQWDAEFSVADYMLFLGYSGLILREAFASLELSQPVLLTWGFHDGDMFVLGRKQQHQSLQVICQ